MGWASNGNAHVKVTAELNPLDVAGKGRVFAFPKIARV